MFRFVAGDSSAILAASTLGTEATKYGSAWSYFFVKLGRFRVSFCLILSHFPTWSQDAGHELIIVCMFYVVKLEWGDRQDNRILWSLA
jgi:hypothetical protein